MFAHHQFAYASLANFDPNEKWQTQTLSCHCQWAWKVCWWAEVKRTRHKCQINIHSGWCESRFLSPIWLTFPRHLIFHLTHLFDDRSMNDVTSFGKLCHLCLRQMSKQFKQWHWNDCHNKCMPRRSIRNPLSFHSLTHSHTYLTLSEIACTFSKHFNLFITAVGSNAKENLIAKWPKMWNSTHFNLMHTIKAIFYIILRSFLLIMNFSRLE